MNASAAPTPHPAHKAQSDALMRVWELARKHGSEASCVAEPPRELVVARVTARALGCTAAEIGTALALGWIAHTADSVTAEDLAARGLVFGRAVAR